MEINFGTYWHIKIKDTRASVFKYKGENYYLLTHQLWCQRKIDTLKTMNNDVPVSILKKNRFINITDAEIKLNQNLPIKLNINNEIKLLDGCDLCTIIVNNKTKIVINESTPSLIVKKVIPFGTCTSDGIIKSNLNYSYSNGIVYNLPIATSISPSIGKNIGIQSKFSISDVGDTLKNAALKTENFTKNEIAGEIESILNPST